MSRHATRITSDDQLTVYWLTGDDQHREQPREGWWARDQFRSLDCTDAEAAEWIAAAAACVDEVAEARAALARDRPRWGPRWRYKRADAAYADRIRAARLAYEPVRRAIEQRFADAKAAALAKGRLEYARQEQRRVEAKARFEQWERRQAVADRPLANGLTPRLLAEQEPDLVDPPALDPASETLVGDVAAWWSALRAAATNSRARAAAVPSVIAAIAATIADLEAAGRPGIQPVTAKHLDILQGWWVDFDWSGLPDLESSGDPDIPVGHHGGGTWRFGVYKPRRIALVVSSSGAYQFATEHSESVANGMFTRYSWRYRDGPEFADSLFPTVISFIDNLFYSRVRVPVENHVDPTLYVPYVEGVAERAVAALTAIRPD